MGHRREVFRPRTRRQVRKQIENALKQNAFSKVANLAAYQYSTRSIADDFAIALVAAAEAIALGKQVRWERSDEELVTAGIAIAEKRFECHLSKYRKQIVSEVAEKSVRRARRGGENRDDIRR